MVVTIPSEVVVCACVDISTVVVGDSVVSGSIVVVGVDDVVRTVYRVSVVVWVVVGATVVVGVVVGVEVVEETTFGTAEVVLAVDLDYRTFRE